MNKLLLLNIKSIKKNIKFKNLCLVNFLIVLFIFILIFINIFNNNSINKIVNDQNNRNFIIDSFKDKNDLNEFLDNNKYLFESVSYDVYASLDGYYISSNGLFSENLLAVILNSKNKNIKFKDFRVDKIITNDEVRDNIICINQKLSKYIFDNNLYDSFLISFIIKDYSMINEIYYQLDKYNIAANLNSDSISTYNMYVNINSILNILFIVLLFFITILLFILNFLFLKEEEKNIYLYNVLGVFKNKIIYIYTISYFMYIFIIYCLFLLIFFVLFFILDVFNIMLFSLFLKFVIYITISFFIHLFIIFLCVLIFVYFKCREFSM